MKPHFFHLAFVGFVALSTLPITARAQAAAVAAPASTDDSQLSPERLEMLDKRGYFTIPFKTAVYQLIAAKKNKVQAEADEKTLENQLPDLKTQEKSAEDQVASLRQELEKYSHPDNVNFAALQDRMKDPSAKPEDLAALAQAYVWAFPTSPHQTEAQQYLEQIQKKIADQQQADRDAEAARVAAHQKMVQRALVRDLNLLEWKDFLRDMTQEEVAKYLGRAGSGTVDYWIYTGPWITDPVTGQKAGLQVNFSGMRVINVVEGPLAP